MTNPILAEIKDAARDWSRYKRRSLRAWPKTSMMGKIRELGPVGAAIRAFGGGGPQDGYEISKEVNAFERVFRDLHEIDQDILVLMYLKGGSAEKKAKANDCSVATLYNKRKQALVSMIPGWLREYRK